MAEVLRRTPTVRLSAMLGWRRSPSLRHRVRAVLQSSSGTGGRRSSRRRIASTTRAVCGRCRSASWWRGCASRRAVLRRRIGVSGLHEVRQKAERAQSCDRPSPLLRACASPLCCGTYRDSRRTHSRGAVPPVVVQDNEQQIASRLKGQPTAELGRQWRADLLDVGILTARLHARGLASPTDAVRNPHIPASGSQF